VIETREIPVIAGNVLVMAVPLPGGMLNLAFLGKTVRAFAVFCLTTLSTSSTMCWTGRKIGLTPRSVCGRSRPVPFRHGLLPRSACSFSWLSRPSASSPSLPRLPMLFRRTRCPVSQTGYGIHRTAHSRSLPMQHCGPHLPSLSSSAAGSTSDPARGSPPSSSSGPGDSPTTRRHRTRRLLRLTASGTTPRHPGTVWCSTLRS